MLFYYTSYDPFPQLKSKEKNQEKNLPIAKLLKCDLFHLQLLWKLTFPFYFIPFIIFQGCTHKASHREASDINLQTFLTKMK